MIRPTMLMLSCFSCSPAFGYPAPKLPAQSPTDQIKIGMTQKEVQKLLPDKWWAGGFIWGSPSQDADDGSEFFGGGRFPFIQVLYQESNIRVGYVNGKVISVEKMVGWHNRSPQWVTILGDPESKEK